MAYTFSEWLKLKPSEKQLAVEALTKSRAIKVGKRVKLDHLMIGTSIKEAVITGVRPNTTYDVESSPLAADDLRRYPDLERNVTIIVESKDGQIIEVKPSEILEVMHN